LKWTSEQQTSARWRSTPEVPCWTGTAGSSGRQQVWRAWQELDAWPDFPPALQALRRVLPVVSFTMLPTAMVVSVSR